jgi:hypothetical protein
VSTTATQHFFILPFGMLMFEGFLYVVVLGIRWTGVPLEIGLFAFIWFRIVIFSIVLACAVFVNRKELNDTLFYCLNLRQAKQKK